MELAYAALQQLCSPILDSGASACRIRSATRLSVAFGLSRGRAPNPFLVGLAVLGLLSEAAEERPLLCVVDDAQWLDRASARALAFVAGACWRRGSRWCSRRARARRGVRGLPGAPMSEPLGRRDARALLESVLPARLDEPVLERIVVETRGNPLALLELPRGLTPAQLAGGFGLPAALPLSARIEESFTRRLANGSRATRGGCCSWRRPTRPAICALVWRAARRLGIPESAARRGGVGRLAGVCGAGVVFRHPLVRSAVYRAAAAGRAQRGPPRPGGRDRSGDRPGSPRLAPGAGGVHARRGRRRRARAFGGASAGARRLRRGRRLPRALLRPDARRRPSRPGARSPRPGEARGGRARRGARRSRRTRRPARWTASSGRELDSFAPGSRSRRIVGTRRRGCCSAAASDSSRSTLDWPARPTSTRCRPPCSPVAWQARAALERSRPRCAARPASDAARGRGPAARRVGVADHRRPDDRNAGRAGGIACVRERTTSERTKGTAWLWLAGRAAGYIWDYEAGTR